MPTRRAHHRNIWGGEPGQSQAFHRSRFFAAVRELVAFARHVEPISGGMYRARPALRLKALEAADEAEPYIAQEGWE